MTEAEHLAQMHEFLRSRVARALAAWRAGAAPGETIKIVESVRALATQQAYFKAGKSKADGIQNFSLHQFSPALAADAACLRAGKYVQAASDPAWERWAACAEAEGLEAGLRWTTIRDGPHVQAGMVDRVKLVQAAVGVTPDGSWGSRTQAAVAARVTLRPGRAGWSALSPANWQVLTGGA